MATVTCLMRTDALDAQSDESGGGQSAQDKPVSHRKCSCKPDFLAARQAWRVRRSGKFPLTSGTSSTQRLQRRASAKLAKAEDRHDLVEKSSTEWPVVQGSLTDNYLGGMERIATVV